MSVEIEPEEREEPPEPVQQTLNPDVIAYCNKLKDNLKTLSGNERIRMTHDNGREEILEGNDKELEKQRTKALMEEHCQ